MTPEQKAELNRLDEELLEASSAFSEALFLARMFKGELLRGNPTFEALPLFNQSMIEFGSWECKESPTLKCVYDTVEDPAMDDCIFCGQPHERK